jgi:ABC-type bacteriocin/lantibiotic exporter with double-glycine peptidase domain
LLLDCHYLFLFTLSTVMLIWNHRWHHLKGLNFILLNYLKKKNTSKFKINTHIFLFIYFYLYIFFGDTTQVDVPESWPWDGCVEFDGVSFQYHPDLPLVLRDVWFSIKKKK